jgi:hypothetical protein
MKRSTACAFATAAWQALQRGDPALWLTLLSTRIKVT